jgi:glycosyltransferase involved in cell wall biosynthesis
MGRIDPRKRPELALSLAEKFPDVTFHVAGKSRNPEYKNKLMAEFGHFSNIHFHGLINQFEGAQHHQLLSQSWIHINSAIREGLPNSFVEAAGHKCAILSHVDPDGFASRFGAHVANDDFETGLKNLLRLNQWKLKGEKGYDYVRNTYDVPIAINAHEEIYDRHFKNSLR